MKLSDLILRGMRPFFTASDADIIKEIAQGILSKEYKVFTLENAAFCILRMPQKALDMPQVLHFYCEKPSLRTKLVAHVLDFVKNSGYNKLRAINGSGFPDEVWQRAFRHKDWEIKPVKTVFEFEVKK